MSLPFHLVFAQIETKFYLIVLQHEHTPSINISTEVTRSRHCPHIRELFNQQIIDYQILHRVKFYHLPCKKDPNLICFHDNEIFMCLCTKEKNANCFHFDFNMTYNCMGWNDCQNEGKCFQDNPTCPTKTMCVCQECFYGIKCQFSKKQFGLSLDVILGYKILPHIGITEQSIYVIISIVLATVMLIGGLISGILCIWTFQSKSCLKAEKQICMLNKTAWLDVSANYDPISPITVKLTIPMECRSQSIHGVRYLWRETPCQFKEVAVYSTADSNLPAPPFIYFF
ncbi:unnamed protein product [Rotaria sp. Silwood1]|nr:unnamed protein product [Rotaria sp. Silwood1]